MLEKSDTPLAPVLKAFNAHELEVAFLVPTETGLAKSIMDATASMRAYLEASGIHDYAAQPQGPDHKRVVPAVLYDPEGITETSASLYRPATKAGDPRIWFRGLGKYARPWNLLAVIAGDGALHVVNCSAPATLDSMRDPATPLGAFAAAHAPPPGAVAAELLERVRAIARRGFVQTLRAGDTGVGMTLETLLGISANSHQAPDYKGIEIKAKRLKKGRQTRSTLFSQVPDWSLSPVGSAWNLLQRYGYDRNGVRQLYHEMNAAKPNSLGAILEVDAGVGWLKQNQVGPGPQDTTHVVTWRLEKLRERLEKKHAETFWVGAETRGKGAEEAFRYIRVEHTRNPRATHFEALLEAGVISVDYTLKEKAPGRVRDRGYLFKINPADMDALFPPAQVHQLA